MSIELGIKNCFLMQIYGDALGFAYENTTTEELRLIPFNLKYNDKLEIKKKTGQWSDLTELLLIQTKSLRDIKEKSRVTVDLLRFKDELRYWSYYKHGNNEQIINKINQEVEFQKSEEFFRNRRGYGFSRIVSIILANKNYGSGLEEIYQQVLFFNRHPQVIISALLLARAVYLLLDTGLKVEELIDELKRYIIALRLPQLEESVDNQLPQSYTIQFEREKIDYLMALDRVKKEETDWLLTKEWDSRRILLTALSFLRSLREEGSLKLGNLDRRNIKESLAIAYGLWGTTLRELPSDISNIKDWNFISSMAEYLLKIRNYEIDKRGYENTRFTDIFNLPTNQPLKHPILSNIKITNKREQDGFTIVEIESKTGDYTLIRES